MSKIMMLNIYRDMLNIILNEETEMIYCDMLKIMTLNEEMDFIYRDMFNIMLNKETEMIYRDMLNIMLNKETDSRCRDMLNEETYVLYLDMLSMLVNQETDSSCRDTLKMINVNEETTYVIYRDMLNIMMLNTYRDMLNIILNEETEMIYCDMLNIMLHEETDFIYRDMLKIMFDEEMDNKLKDGKIEKIMNELSLIENNNNVFYNLKEKTEFNSLEKNFFIENSLIKLGLFIILTSLFFKLALSPFHLWSPDIYEGSPSSTTFFFTVISKISIFIFLLKICYISFYSFITDWQLYLLVVSLISIIVGAIGGLKQKKFKSLLAYSSISNMGLILVSFSAGNFEGIKAIFYYFIIYILSGLAIWSIILILRLKKKNSSEKHNKDLGDFSILKESNIVLAYASVITLFTIAGIPPTVGFLAKIYIFLSLTTASLYFIALISIVSTVISTFYYIRILKTIFFENLLVGKLFYPIYSKNIIICNFLFLLLLFLFVSPEFISFYSYKTTLYLNKTFY
jgi:hypothetical protein